MQRLLGLLGLFCATSALAIGPTKEPVSPAGVQAIIDLPASQHMKNVGGRDGSGLCVFTSLQHAAYWQNLRVLDGFREWMRKQPGGGWPEKVDDMLARFCKEKGVILPPYIQHTGGDVAFLELALKTDRIVSVTYDGRDDFYSGKIAHMVNLAHLDESVAAIIDNNRPGNWVWMTRAEFLSRWKGSSGGWAVVFLADPPPPHQSSGFNALACICGDHCKCKAGECPSKCPVSFGQCPGGKCGIPTQPVDRSAPDRVQNTKGEWLVRGPDGTYRPEADAPENYGVQSGKIHESPKYSISGVEVTEATARAALGEKGDSLKDDSDRWHLTAVGDAAFLRQFTADVAALPVSARSKLLVQAYQPGDWPITQYSLPVGVSLRRPSPVRTSAEVGSIDPASYTASKLAALLSSRGGPLFVEPPPAPIPSPAPSPVSPASPLAPNVPAPLDTPTDYTNRNLFLMLAAGMGLLIVTRKA